MYRTTSPRLRTNSCCFSIQFRGLLLCSPPFTTCDDCSTLWKEGRERERERMRERESIIFAAARVMWKWPPRGPNGDPPGEQFLTSDRRTTLHTHKMHLRSRAPKNALMEKADCILLESLPMHGFCKVFSVFPLNLRGLVHCHKVHFLRRRREVQRGDRAKKSPSDRFDCPPPPPPYVYVCVEGGKRES